MDVAEVVGLGAVAVALVNAAFVARTTYMRAHSRLALIPSPPIGDLPKLSIVVPARDEERQIDDCLRSLQAQAYPDFEIVVVDDRSRDATAAIVQGIAARDARVRLVRGAELPSGWVGKPWALTQGASVARGDWLLFTDADTAHEPLASASAVAFARARELDFLSVITDQTCVSWPERALLPTILTSIAFGIGSFDAINDPRRPDTALFNGQFVLARRAAYDAIGGHAAVRGEIAEDFELARLVKRDGRFRAMLVGGAALVRARMYRSFGEIWEGFTKNFALGVRGRPVVAALAIGYFAILSPGTPLLLIVALALHIWVAVAVAAISMFASQAAAEAGMRTFRLPRWSGLWAPLGFAMVLALFVVSLLKHKFGGVTWRGRRYAPRSSRPG